MQDPHPDLSVPEGRNETKKHSQQAPRPSPVVLFCYTGGRRSAGDAIVPALPLLQSFPASVRSALEVKLPRKDGRAAVISQARLPFRDKLGAVSALFSTSRRRLGRGLEYVLV